jgi:hypothetical protein
MSKDFRHYRAVEKQLGLHTDVETQRKILDGMDTLSQSSKPAVKVEWARELMQRMDALLDAETCIRVREGCACVLSNEKSIYARNFRRLRKLFPDDSEYLDEVVKYLNATAPLRRCGEVTREGDKIYSIIGRSSCGCPVLHEGLLEAQTEPLPVTWCHCSKGSLLSVYRYVFPDKVCEMEIVRTVATGGEDCCFVTTYR